MKSTRRDLLKKAALSGTAIAAISLTAACSKKENKAPSGDADPGHDEVETNAAYVTEDNSTAKALGYVEDANSLGEDVRADKGATKGADQNCANCQFFTPEGSTGGLGGKCSLFPGKLVKTEGWCRSWSLKAQV